MKACDNVIDFAFTTNYIETGVVLKRKYFRGLGEINSYFSVIFQ